MTTGWLGDPAAYAHIGPADMVHALYGDAFTADRRCVVFGRDRSSVWCATPEQLAAVAANMDSRTDVYFGSCLQAAEAERPGARGEAETVTVMPGVWADVDIAGAGKKKAYAPSVEAAVALLASRIEQPPSIAIVTGGVHFWWLFDEPWVLESVAERKEATAVSQRWQARLRAVLAEKGWALDATHDLARVLRLPGTHNHKEEHDPPFLVHVVTWEVA